MIFISFNENSFFRRQIKETAEFVQVLMEEVSSELENGEEEKIPAYEKIKIKYNLALQKLEVVVQNFQTIEHQKGKCAFFPNELGDEVRNKEPNFYI